MLQMVHPDRVVVEADLAKLPLIEPVYPLTEGLSLNQVRKAVDGALARVPDLAEWQDADWVARAQFPVIRAGAAQRAPARRRSTTSFPKARRGRGSPIDELLAGQLALALVRAHIAPAGRPRHRGARRVCARS